MKTKTLAKTFSVDDFSPVPFVLGICWGLAIAVVMLAVVAMSGCAAPVEAETTPAVTAPLSRPVSVTCKTRIYLFETSRWATWETDLAGSSFSSSVLTDNMAGFGRVSASCGESAECASSLGVSGGALSYAVTLNQARTEATLTQPYPGLRVGYIDTAKCTVSQ